MTLSNLEGQFSCLKPFLPSFIGDYNTYSLRCVYTWLAKHLWSLILAICRKWQTFGGYRQSRTLWKWQYLRNGARCYYTPVIWSVTWPKDSCHFRWLWMTLKVIRLLQGYSNAIRRTLFCATFRTVSTDSAHRTVPRRQLSCFLFALLAVKKERSDERTHGRMNISSAYVKTVAGSSKNRSRCSSVKLQWQDAWVAAGRGWNPSLFFPTILSHSYSVAY